MSQETEELELLPFSLEIEIDLIRCLSYVLQLNDDVAIIDIFDGVKNINYFYFSECQTVFSLLKNLYNPNFQINLLAIMEEMKKQNINYLDFKHFFDAPRQSGFSYNRYLKVLEEKYHRRNLLNLSVSIKELVYDETKDIWSALDKAENKISEFQEQKQSKDLIMPIDILDPLASKILAYNDLHLQGIEPVDRDRIPTGFKRMDKLLNCGFNPSDLMIIAGRPAMGKTTMMLNIALNVVEAPGQAVFISSLEMSKEQLMNKLIAFKTGIPFGRLISGKFSRMERDLFLQAYAGLSELPLIIDDFSTQTTNDIKAKIRRVKNLYPDKKVLAIVDYLGLITPIERGFNRNDEISRISGALKGIAKDLHVPVIALSQLSRECEKRNNKRPMLSDLRDSGSCEQDSDIIGMIYRDEYYNPDTTKKKIAELNIVKHRNGDVGKIEFFFEGGVSKFSELET